MKDLSVLKPPFDEQKKRFLKLKENLQNDMNGGTVDTDYPTASGYNAQGNFPPAFIKSTAPPASPVWPQNNREGIHDERD